jgi:hypothetical protein
MGWWDFVIAWCLIYHDKKEYKVWGENNDGLSMFIILAIITPSFFNINDVN